MRGCECEEGGVCHRGLVPLREGGLEIGREVRGRVGKVESTGGGQVSDKERGKKGHYRRMGEKEMLRGKINEDG